MKVSYFLTVNIFVIYNSVFNCFDTLLTECQDNCTSPSNGVCVSAGVCRCNDGWFGDACQTPCVNGTVINGECVCNHSCYGGISCDIICGNHGTCSPDDQCVCDWKLGYKGPLCTEPGCPGFPLNCNGRGSCNEITGNCTCGGQFWGRS